jgi:hypothetical protein
MFARCLPLCSYWSIGFLPAFDASPRFLPDAVFLRFS